MYSSSSLIFLFLLLTALPSTFASHDYVVALKKSLLFFEAQRSGFLPPNQRVKWRSNSGLNDGKASGIYLVGGYYDAGDNVKFGLPMAFTVTMLSWSIIEYRRQMAATGELAHAMDAVKWGTDYFIRAHPESDVLYGEVGDGFSDHYCWQRAEDMTTDRRAYKIDTTNPGSDLAGETAAAMAAASIVFRSSNPTYAKELLLHAKQLFSFADKHRGKYDSSITVARNYYNSVSGYADELLWAAAWLYQATANPSYLQYLSDNGQSLGGTGWSMTEFGWDVKYVGVQVLVSKFLMKGKGGPNTEVLELYRKKAEAFICSCTGKGSKKIKKTPGGLFFWQNWNNMQFVSGASFLLTVYSDYLTKSRRMLSCGSEVVKPRDVLQVARSQVDYILGDNPRGASYLVGYGNNYPQRVHHRGSSIISFKVNPSFISCKEGYADWYKRNESDPNVLVGALVGGPDVKDEFEDERDNYEQTEPATYNTASMVGVLARLSVRHGSVQDELIGVVNYGIDVYQRVKNSWRLKGILYTLYVGEIVNKSGKVVTQLKLSVKGLHGPLFGLGDKGGGIYGFPFWVRSLGVGGSFEFTYVHAASAASVKVLYAS